jgi:hypothetical protein
VASISVRPPDELLVEMANTLASLKTSPPRIWVCEGPDDREAIEHHDGDALVFVAGNRDAVLATAALLAQPKPQARRWSLLAALVSCLVDRDYEPSLPTTPTVKVTRTCSLEGDLLLASGGEVLRRLVLGISPQEAQTLVDRAAKIGDDFGRLRLHSISNGCGLRLDRFPVVEAVDQGKIDWEAVSALLGKRHPSDGAGLQSAIVAARSIVSPCGPCARANGHDLVRLLQSEANNHPKVRTSVSPREVFRALVGAADPSWLAQLGSGHATA